MQIEKKKVDELKAAPYNPRKDLKPGDAEYEKLKRSIETFGYVEPVIMYQSLLKRSLQKKSWGKGWKAKPDIVFGGRWNTKLQYRSIHRI